MWRTNGVSRYAVPFTVIPERGQVSENVSHPPNKQACDVFHDCKAGSYFANNAAEFNPQSAAGAGHSLTSTGDADVLTREPAADNVGRSNCAVEGSDIVPDGDVGPVLLQDGATVAVEFNELDGVQSRALETKREASDP